MNMISISLKEFLSPPKRGIDPLAVERIISGDVLVNRIVERDPNRVLCHGDEVTDGDRIIILDTTPQTPPEDSDP